MKEPTLIDLMELLNATAFVESIKYETSTQQWIINYKHTSGFLPDRMKYELLWDFLNNA